ncbi:MAG: putative replicase [Cressdnaviricota sp.]|nr:MAG: putative replicase [Cressdnaviricota sp.]
MTHSTKTHFKPLHTIPSPEEIHLKTKYTFNFNPSDEYQYFGKEDRLKMFTNWSNTYVFNTFCAKLEVYLEISRLGRLHYHGTIEFDNVLDIREFFIDKLHSITLKGTLEIDTITDLNIWMTYCTKSKHVISYSYKSSPFRRLTSQQMVMYNNEAFSDHTKGESSALQASDTTESYTDTSSSCDSITQKPKTKKQIPKK